VIIKGYAWRSKFSNYQNLYHVCTQDTLLNKWVTKTILYHVCLFDKPVVSCGVLDVKEMAMKIQLVSCLQNVVGLAGNGNNNNIVLDVKCQMESQWAALGHDVDSGKALWLESKWAGLKNFGP